MKLWECSLSQALGQVGAVRHAIVGVGGHIMPDEIRAKLREAERLIGEAERDLHEIVIKHEDSCAIDVPWKVRP